MLFWLVPGPARRRGRRRRAVAVLTCGFSPEAAGRRLPASRRSTRRGSTNDDALRGRARRRSGPALVVAAEQLPGRGRHGRALASPPGNLYASLLLIDPCEPAVAPQLGFVAGLALHEAVERGHRHRRAAARTEMAERSPPRRRQGRRPAARRPPHRRTARFAVIIGFGVNVAVAPEGTPYPAARSARRSASGLDARSALRGPRGRVRTAFAAWQTRGAAAADPFAPIRARWLERAAGPRRRRSRLRLPVGRAAAAPSRASTATAGCSCAPRPGWN